MTEEATRYEVRVTTRSLVPAENPTLYHDRAWSASIDSEGTGEFVKISDTQGRHILVEPGEWVALRTLVDTMIAECREVG